MKDLKLVLSDVGGVILNDLDVIYQVFDDATRHFESMPLPYKAFNKHFTSNLKDLYEFTGITAPMDMVYDFIKKRFPYYLSKIDTFDGAREFIRFLKESYFFGINTSYATDDLIDVFEAIKWNIEFDVMVTRSVVENQKPHPEPIYYACRKLNVRPDEVLMIGDTASDVLCGKSAGSRTVGVTWGTNGREKLQQASPDYIADSWDDIINYVNGDK